MPRDAAPGLTHSQLCLAGHHHRCRKMPPSVSSLLGITAGFPSPACAEGLMCPGSILPALLIPWGQLGLLDVVCTAG